MIARRLPLELVLLVAVAACGASQRDRTIRVTATTLNAVTDGVTAYTLEREERVARSVEAGTVTPDEGKAQLAAHRKAIDTFWLQLVAAYRLLIAVSAFEDDKVPIGEVTRAASAVKAAWDALQKGSP